MRLAFPAYAGSTSARHGDCSPRTHHHTIPRDHDMNAQPIDLMKHSSPEAVSEISPHP